MKNVGISLFSQIVSNLVSSAPLSLTSVFGMGTGEPSMSSTPTSLPHYFYLTTFIPFYQYFFSSFFLGDSYGNRTRVSGVRGRCLYRLTNEPSLVFFLSPFPLVHHQGLEPGTPWLRVRCSTIWANGAHPSVLSLPLRGLCTFSTFSKSPFKIYSSFFLPSNFNLCFFSLFIPSQKFTLRIF